MSDISLYSYIFLYKVKSEKSGQLRREVLRLTDRILVVGYIGIKHEINKKNVLWSNDSEQSLNS